MHPSLCVLLTAGFVRSNGWSLYDGVFLNPWLNAEQDCYMDADVTVAHTANTMTLRFGANLDSPGDDESWAFSGLTIRLLPC